MELALVERGPPLPISAREWNALDLERVLAEAERAGVVKAERSGDTVLLRAGVFVGELAAPGVHLSISPKRPELKRRIEDLAREHRNRTVHAPEQRPGQGEARFDNVPVAFADALRSVVHEGVPWSYHRVTEPTSRPRGRIDFGATVRTFLARGIRHKVVTGRSVKEHDLILCGVLRAAAMTLADMGANRSLLSDVAVLLSALDDSEVLSSEEALGRIDDLRTTYSDRAEVTLALTAARALLLRERALPGIFSTSRTTVTRFINLEALWERAVKRLFEEAVGRYGEETVLLHPLAGTTTTLFDGGGPAIDPDIIAYRDAHATWVVDAKYKVVPAALADDVYQMACYVDRCRGERGLLVYLTEGRSRGQALGRTESGRLVAAAFLSLEDLRSEQETECFAGIVNSLAAA